MGKQSREKEERRLQSEGQPTLARIFVSKWEKLYLLIIEWGTYLAVFTPLIMFKFYFFPFVVPKTIFFRIIVDIIFIAYILLVFCNRKYLPKLNALTISVTVFLGITILTSITGINFEKSFWSTFERMTGLLTFLHLYIFFIVLASVFKEKKYWERILNVSILVGVFICLYVFFSEDAAGRSGGTIGNVSFMAAYLLFDIFFATILFFTKKGAWRIFFGISLIIMLLTLFLSPELPRGAIGTLFLGFFLVGLGYMFFSGKRLLKRLAPVVLVLVVLLGVGISQTSFFKEKIIDIKDIPGESRKIVWQMGFDAWQDKFLLGWGQENFNVAFTQYFNPAVASTGDIWYDRVHNVVLDTALTSGFLGLLSYLSIFGIAIFGLLRTCPKIIKKSNLLFPLGMIAILMVYFLQNIWVFDMISTYMIFFLSLAFINFLLNKKEQDVEYAYSGKKNPIYPFVGVLLIMITLFTIYFGNIQPARASQYIVKGIISPLEKVTLNYQKAIKASPMSIVEAPEQFSRKISEFAFDPDQNQELLKEGFQSAAEELEKSIAKNPEDFRLYLMLGRHYNNFYLITQDPEKLNQAEKILQEAIELSPKNQQVYWTIAQTRLSQGRDQESIEFMQKAVDLNPQFGHARWYLAMTYRLTENYELALEEVKAAEKVDFNWRESIEYLKQVINIYQNLEDDEELVNLYFLGVSLSPGDPQFLAGLAVALANVGRFEEAKQFAEEALKLNSELAPQIEQFLKELEPFLK